MKINKILAIAINDYDDKELNKVQNCKRDVKTLIQHLTTKYDFEDVEFIYEKKDTTRRSLIRTFQNFFINRLEDENVLLIYAGHGEYNPNLQTGYWQPSDAEKDDSSTWISLPELLTFIRASKAFHIGIISDACFSGSIFEPISRGGGIDAYATRKSRLCLTSGGKEKVSDGQKDDMSPFAKVLVDQLLNNQLEELPFSLLASNTLLASSKLKRQTPMFGALESVGHEGGSFIFRLKKEHKKIENTTKFLKDRMGNLFIPISEYDEEDIKELYPITKKKREAVKNQTYEKAAEYRDKEKEIEKRILDRTSNYLQTLVIPIEPSKEEIEEGKRLNERILKQEELKKLEKEPEEKKIKRLKK